ncbi:unnamed protein product [Rotaria socialis]|uniref:Xenotropic and polytropic retrovirus receptor 1 n=1 Tax=Rotaria socialis TaxID=392032 RepID=A0A817UYD4_9BILA|nr:unnamed protein product [Rotaria socialis]
MKFAEHLLKNRTPEWYSQYIEYDEMKRMLYESAAEAKRIIDINEHSAREQYILRADEEFFQCCEKEASKINNFFAEKLAETLRLFEPLKKELNRIEQNHQSQHDMSSTILILDDSQGGGNGRIRSDRTLLAPLSAPNSFRTWLGQMKPRKSVETIQKLQRERTQNRKVNELKAAFSEFYLMLVLLKNYQTLNSSGFRKILAKHDKLYLMTSGDEWWKVHIESAPFQTSNRIDTLMVQVEDLYTNSFENGDRKRAIQRLHIPPLEEKQSHLVTFRVGVFVGILCLLIPMVFILSNTLQKSQSGKLLAWRPALHLYRSSFLVILHIIFVGINIYGWSHSGVNHVLIFEIDPRNHLTYQRLLEIGTFLMVLWFLSFIAFIISSYYDVRPFAQPLAFVILLILLLINPIQIFYYQSRLWFLKNLGRVFLSPYFHVDFTGFWLGDQLISLDLVFFDLQYFICFYMNDVDWTRPTEKHGVFCSDWSQFLLQTIFILLPSWFRFAQCIRRRRAANPFLYLWFISSLISSTYKLIWDFKMDYGLFDKNASENKYLREQIIYSSKAYYYVAIIENIAFRYIWIINIFLYFDTSAAEYADIVGFSFGIIEIFRRFIWNFFRLENEHLNNCGEFRAVRDISIQKTVTVASGYSTRLERLGTISNLGNEHNPKRHHTITTGEQVTTTEKYRKTTIRSATLNNENISLQNLTTATHRNQVNDLSEIVEASSDTMPTSNSLVLVNPNYHRTLST